MRRGLLGGDWIVVATAHPAKFETIVEPLTGKSLEVPETLAQILKRPIQSREIEPALEALAPELED